jgi:hypothetical protein
LVAHHDGIDYISFDFGTKLGSGISLLPGYAETFTITTPTIDNRDDFIFYKGRPATETLARHRRPEFFLGRQKRGKQSGRTRLHGNLFRHRCF